MYFSPFTHCHSTLGFQFATRLLRARERQSGSKRVGGERERGRAGRRERGNGTVAGERQTILMDG